MRFSVFLKEFEEKMNGIYVALYLSEESADKLYNFMESLDIPNIITKDQYHSTLVYSTEHFDEVENIDMDLPIETMIKGFKILGEDMLVIELESDEMHEYFEKTRELGASWDYDEFIPHISVAKDFHGEIPSEVPDFPIVMENIKIEELNQEYSYETVDAEE